MKPKKIIDLSIILYNCMPKWPTHPNFLYEQITNVPRDGATHHIIRQMNTHTGTHIDAPSHYIIGGKTVDQLPIEAFAGEGVVLDISYKKPGEAITVEDLKTYDHEIKAGDILMLHTGWDKRMGFNLEYLFEWPYLVEETAKYLVKKKVKALGVDTLSVGGWAGKVPGHGPTDITHSGGEVHRILLKSGTIIVETLANLDKVLDGSRVRRAYFIYAPISIKGAEAGPCRASALIF